MPTTRSQSASALSCAGRKRKATAAAPAPTPPAKKTKMTRSADATYLKRAIDEFSQQHAALKKCRRRTVLENSLRYFRRFALPGPRDAHSPPTPDAARRLLASDAPLDRPVFVRDGANWSAIDPEAARRPVEQLFDFLHDLDEEEEYKDDAGGRGGKFKAMSMAEMKTRFLERDAGAIPPLPRNLPDLVNPMLDHGIPRFMQSAQCSLLPDILRRVLDCEADELCDCADATGAGAGNAPCGHKITRAEFATLHHTWRYWQGTVMLAEPGAITYPHWDKYSTSTWIACLEGEIGCGWLSDPSDEEKTSWLKDVARPAGRWLFKVLRPGDAVYMPPGTVHFVFRRPRGGQTMGFASQMLRRADTMAWLRHLRIELEAAVSDEIEDAPYELVVRGLMNGLLHLIRSAHKDDSGKFGDEAQIRELFDAVEVIHNLVNQLDEAKS